MTQDDHSAAASALGYQFQTWWCLFELVRRCFERPDAAISLELHDDIAWEADGSATELLQSKHHLRSTRSLGDRSDDVWRTLAAWMDSPAAFDPSGPSLYLVTTDEAPEDTAASNLRPNTLDVAQAEELLLAAARESTAEGTKRARERFIALDPSAREALVSKIRVIDQVVKIEDVDGEVRRELRLLPPLGHEDLFMRLLWGWWDREAMRMLRRLRPAMTGHEIIQHLNDLRDQFAQDRLPTLVDLRQVDEEELALQHDNNVFVHQLRWVSWPPLNLQKSIVDYFRAYSQAQQWVDEELIGSDELDLFQAELCDEWQREFEFMLVELGGQATDDEKAEAGLKLARQLLASTEVKVRPRYDDAFFARGTRHDLAERARIGWHPEFEARVKTLLVPGTASHT
jgi:hypothetical protein